MSVKCALIRKSTGEIINPNINYPREDMEPIVGLDPDLEYLVKYTPFIVPEYDSRIFKLITTEEVTTEPHPDYPHLNQYKITYSTKRRPNEEIEVAVKNAENEANEQQVNYTERNKLFILALGVLIRRLDNLQTTPKEQAILDKVLKKAVKVWKNDATVKAKLKQLVDGEEPEIDAGWEKE